MQKVYSAIHFSKQYDNDIYRFCVKLYYILKCGINFIFL